MNKNQSKYFNTAKLMNDALLLLLAKKDFELITVKDVCEKAGVNRSTFYLHYETMDDLLSETLENVNKSFIEKFREADVPSPNLQADSLEELVIVDEQRLIPFLEFVKENVHVYKAFSLHPVLFNVRKIYQTMFDGVFQPILARFGFSVHESQFIMEYYFNGMMALVMKWASGGCKEDVQEICRLLLLCVRPVLN